MPRHTSKSAKKEAYHRLLATGNRRLTARESDGHPLAALVEEFLARRAAGDKVSIRSFCGEHQLSQKQFEACLRPEPAEQRTGGDPAVLTYYQRPEVQQALYLWAQGRRLALHYSRGVVGLGFRSPEHVTLLAAACNTGAPTFHASVGRYRGDRLVAFDLVAEVDLKGDWQACFHATRPLVHALHSAGITFMVKYSGHSSAHVIVPCQGTSYRGVAAQFLRRLPGSLRNTGRLDLSFVNPQHFLRMPYALHEHTGLVSLPLTVAEFDAFDPEMAHPEHVTVDPAQIEQVMAADNSKWLLG